MSFYRPLFCALVLLIATGCASITNRHQYVRVVPESEDTDIYYDGDKVGQGASTVYITRSKHPKIVFKKDAKESHINLDTTYRWGHSFGGNILIYPYTPGGWLIDYMTGAAWEAEDRIDPAKEYKLKNTSRLIILPTTNTNSVDSRMMGRRIERWLQVNQPGLHALPFDTTYYQIVGMGFDHESAEIPDDTDTFNELVYETRATHLVFSEYDDYKKVINLAIYSPYSEKVVKRFSIPHTDTHVSQSAWNWFYTEIFEVVPNTFSIGTLETFYSGCAEQPDLTARYCAASGKRSVLSYLSSISLTSVLHYRKRQPWRVYFRFYPDFSISNNQVEFDKSETTLPDLDMDWVFMSMGYGPRFSFILPVGELFMELTPFVAMNYLRLHSKPNYDKTHWVGKTGVSFQLGMNSWIANHWNMRWYVKAQGQNLLEDRDISAIDPNTKFRGNLMIAQTGLSIGYYFHEEKTKFFDWMGIF